MNYQWIMTILLKGCKPDNFGSGNYQKLSSTNIHGLRLNFVECESFLESSLSWHSDSMWDKLGWLYWFRKFSVTGYLPLIGKDSITHNHGLAVYVKEGLPFAQDLSPKNSMDSYLCFRLVLLYSVSTSFSSIDHLHLYAWFLILPCLT